MTTITLSTWELRVTLATGKERQRYAVTHRWKTKFEAHSHGNAARKDILGCMGECACSKLFNVRWAMTIGTDKAEGDLVLPDGQQVQVRAARYTESGGVWQDVFSHDVSEDQLYVFTLAGAEPDRDAPFGWRQNPEVAILGWLYSKEILEYSYSDTYHGKPLDYPAYIIAVKGLRSLFEFPSQIWL
jgi:hypothetical protein